MKGEPMDAREIIKIANTKFVFEENPEACCVHAFGFSDYSGICPKCVKENKLKEALKSYAESIFKRTKERATKIAQEKYDNSCNDQCDHDCDDDSTVKAISSITFEEVSK